MHSILTRSLRLSCALALACAFTSCATVVRGTRQRVEIESVPSGAVARLDNGISAPTPTHFYLRRRKDATITVSKPGYRTAIIHIRSRYTGTGIATSAAGNFILGGLVGAVIDVATGALKTIEPNRINVTLQKGPQW